MKDTAVDLQFHNGFPTFKAAAQARLAEGLPLEFDPKYFAADFKPVQEDSPILGIRRTAPVFTAEAERFAASEPQAFPSTPAGFGVWFKNQLLDHLARHWDPTHPTLVLHSSGYDSRMLSLALAQLRDEGFDLGEVHFRCHGTEGDTFIEIMQREGWKPSQYSVFPGTGPDAFDVGRWDMPGTTAWLPAASVLNFWRDIVPYGEEKNWNLCGGAGGDPGEYRHLQKKIRPGWNFCRNKWVNHWLITCLGFYTDFIGDMELRFNKLIFPLLGEFHVRAVAQMDDRFVGFDEHGCDLSRAPVFASFKDGLLDIPRARRVYGWTISDARWEEMRSGYAASAFLRDVPGAPSADALIAAMKAQFRRKGNAERLWRFAALWETLQGS